MAKAKTKFEELSESFNIELDDFQKEDYKTFENFIKAKELTIQEATALGYDKFEVVNDLLVHDDSANTKTVITTRYLTPNVGYVVSETTLLDLMVLNSDITKESLRELLKREGVEIAEVVKAMHSCTDPGKMHAMAEKLFEMDYVIDDKLAAKLMDGFDKTHKFLLLSGKAKAITERGWFTASKNYLEQYKDDIPFISAYIIKNAHTKDVAEWFKEYVITLTKDNLYSFLESIKSSEKYPVALNIVMENMATNPGANLPVLKGLLLMAEGINARMLENAMAKCTDPEKMQALGAKFIEPKFKLTNAAVAEKLTGPEFENLKFSLLESGRVTKDVALVLLKSLVANALTDDFPSEKYGKVVENLVRMKIIGIEDATAIYWEDHDKIGELIFSDNNARADTVVTRREEVRVGIDQVTNYDKEEKSLLTFTVENASVTAKALRKILKNEVDPDSLMAAMSTCDDEDKMLVMAEKLATLDCKVPDRLSNTLKNKFKDSYDVLLLAYRIPTNTKGGWVSGYYSALNEYIEAGNSEFIEQFIKNNRDELTTNEVGVLKDYVEAYDYNQVMKEELAKSMKEEAELVKKEKIDKQKKEGKKVADSRVSRKDTEIGEDVETSLLFGKKEVEKEIKVTSIPATSQQSKVSETSSKVTGQNATVAVQEGQLYNQNLIEVRYMLLRSALNQNKEKEFEAVLELADSDGTLDKVMAFKKDGKTIGDLLKEKEAKEKKVVEKPKEDKKNTKGETQEEETEPAKSVEEINKGIQDELTKQFKSSLLHKVINPDDLSLEVEGYKSILLTSVVEAFKEAHHLDASSQMKRDLKLSDKVENELLKAFSDLDKLSNKKLSLKETQRLYQESDKAIEKAVKLAVEGVGMSFTDKIKESRSNSELQK